MSVPNDFAVVHAVYRSGAYDLTTHHGHAAFVDAVVGRLHITDANWGHLKKKPGQTDIHGHGEDSALYKLQSGQAWAVDFVIGARGPSPTPGWNPDPVAYYTYADWLNPEHHDAPPVSAPSYPPYPPNESDVDGAGIALFADFGSAGQVPNPQMFRFAFRVAFSWLTKEVPDLPASVAKHRAEWRAILGLPPL